MDTLLSIAIGVGLSAACGFRIFIPPFVMSLFALYGHLHLTSDFEWMGTYPALIAFAVATGVEIAAYYVPWVDNLLDTVSTPTAIAVGTAITGALLHDTDPLLKWSIAAIAGGGSAGLFQALTGMTRFSSTALTGGIGNPIVSTIELGGSMLLSLLAIVTPILAIAVLMVLLIWLVTKANSILSLKKRFSSNPSQSDSA